MVKDFKYIIKRILIGVGIALTLMFLKGNLLIGVSAKEMSSDSFGGLQVAINGTDNNYIWDVTDGSWENWGSGTLIGNGSIIKTNGASTSSFATVRSVMAYSGNQTFVCKMGSTASNNSTFQNQTFTYECPMIMRQYGLQQIAFVFSHTGGVDFTMRLEVNGTMTFIKDDPNDSSSTAINNQIQNDNTNTTNIINNNNQNTQQQIESQKVCRNIDKNTTISNGYLNSNGQISSSSAFGITDYISLSSSDNLRVLREYSGSISQYFCFYDYNKTRISCISNSTLVVNSNVSIPSNTSYVRFSINNSNDLPSFILCKNGNQAIADGQQQTNQNLQDINNSITDDTGVSDNEISDIFQDLDISSDTPISDLLTMPITLVQAYLDGFGGSCSSINLGSLYGTNLIIPCIDLESKLGSGLWTLIDVLFSLFMVYNIAMLVIRIFDDVTSLNDTFKDVTTGGGM